MTADIAVAETVSKPRKDEHTVRLSSFHTEMAQRLASQQNKAFAEVLTDAVEIGLDVLVERVNRANIWRKTSLKSDVAALIDSLGEEQMRQAIEAMKAMKRESK